MKTVIFLGPTLDLNTAREILPQAIYLPPAGQADLISAVQIYEPQVIGLIDGVFHQSFAVWHKEILYALDRGIHVYGASSMGALRAAETSMFGMVGVGQVYEQYATDVLTDDDEVALAHGDADSGYFHVSEPMVNLRATFHDAVEQGVIDAAASEQFCRIAKAIYYPERTFPHIFKQSLAEGVAEEAVERMRWFARERYVDVKREDAMAMLETIRALPADLAPLQTDFEFNRPHVFETLYDRDRRVRHEGVDISLADIAYHVALHMPDFTQFNFHALNRALVVILADVVGATVDAADVDKEVRRFRLRLRLREDDTFADWLQRNDLSEAEFRELMEEVALCRRMQKWLITRKYLQGTTRLLLDELRLQDRYESWAQQLAGQERLIHDDLYALIFEQNGHLVVDDMVIDHLRATACRMDTHYGEWAWEAGFPDLETLKVELLRSRLGRQGVTDLLADVAEFLGEAEES
jgi:hypothetical protein